MFDTCNCDEDGRISLLDLANRSRSVTEDNHVEQLLELFNLGEESSSGNDKVTFNQFVQRMVALMNSNNNHTDKQCSENHDNDTEDEEDESGDQAGDAVEAAPDASASEGEAATPDDER